MRRLIFFLIGLTISCSSCQMLASKTNTPTTTNVSANTVENKNQTNTAIQDTANSSSSTDSNQNAPATTEEKNLLSFFNGALVVKKTKEYGGGWSAEGVIDESPTSGWASPEKELTGHSLVIELPEKTILKTLSFDTAGTDGEQRGAKDITVEISDQNAETGFQEIAHVSLKDKADNQRFPTEKQIAGRFVRVSFGNNQGSADFVELMEIRGFGEQLTKTPLSNASGTYETNYGDFHIKQEGSSVIGCYEHENGVLKGGIEDRVMKLNWREDGDDSGPAVMVFTADGRRMVGLWWNKADDILTVQGRQWDGTKKSDDIGTCPNIPNFGKANAAQAQLADDLKQKGRATIYGINFDTGSDVIKPESKTTLEQIVALLKENKDWKMTIEGHTDSVGGADYNQKLSERRAAAVKDYLVKAGIETTRLNSAGFGMSKPLASNDNALGRGQNRRVELVKN